MKNSNLAMPDVLAEKSVHVVVRIFISIYVINDRHSIFRWWITNCGYYHQHKSNDQHKSKYYAFLTCSARKNLVISFFNLCGVQLPSLTSKLYCLLNYHCLCYCIRLCIYLCMGCYNIILP